MHRQARQSYHTSALFEEAYPTAEAMAEATPDDIFDYIRSCSYPNNKAKALAGMARRLLSDFGGEVPATMDELLTLRCRPQDGQCGAVGGL